MVIFRKLSKALDLDLSDQVEHLRELRRHSAEAVRLSVLGDRHALFLFAKIDSM